MKILMIHDSLRKDREKLYRQELDSQGIESWELVPANKDTIYPAINIARAHKEAIRRALAADLPQVVIMEDDIRWVCPGAYNRFLGLSENFPVTSPEYQALLPDWDVFISGSYEYQLHQEWIEMDTLFQDERNSLGRVPLRRFSGLHCYMINRKAYEKLLAIPEGKNFDKAMSGIGLNCWMAYPMLALQHTTKSDQTGKTLNYDEIYKEKIKLWDCRV